MRRGYDVERVVLTAVEFQLRRELDENCEKALTHSHHVFMFRYDGKKYSGPRMYHHSDLLLSKHH